MRAAAEIAGLLAVALWLGGLVALGAIVAPIVFAQVGFPQNADAMTLVFRRFDLVAMACAAVALASEAAKRLLSRARSRVDSARAAATVLASVLTVYEGVSVSPRIAALHASGAMRGIGTQGAELARLHDIAEGCGKAEVFLLVAAVTLAAAAWVRAASAPG